MTEEDAARIQERLRQIREIRLQARDPNIMQPQFGLLEPGSNKRRGSVSAHHTKRNNRSMGATSAMTTKRRKGCRIFKRGQLHIEEETT